MSQYVFHMYHENWGLDIADASSKLDEIKFNNFKIAKNELNNVLNVLIPLIS